MSDIEILIDMGIEKCPPEKKAALGSLLQTWTVTNSIALKHYLAAMLGDDVNVSSQIGSGP